MAQLTADNIVDMLIALLPHGDAWPTQRDSWWGEIFYSFADEFVVIANQIELLKKEMSTHTTDLLISEYESDYGLPDCIFTAQTFLQRRAALSIKDGLIGRQDKQFFIDIAVELGYAITIAEFNAANPGPPTAFQGVALTGDDWNFVWQITADTNITPRTYGSQYNEQYRNANGELLECTLRAYAHDHRVLLFNFI